MRKDGQEFPLELSVATWQSGQGTFYGGIIRDITKRKQAEEALRKAHVELEARVQERTTELSRANTELRQEVNAHQQAETQKQRLLHDLGERVKELTVLHRMARLLQTEQKTGLELLQEIAGVLPAAWRYPEVAAARVMFDGAEYRTFLLSGGNCARFSQRATANTERLKLCTWRRGRTKWKVRFWPKREVSSTLLLKC
ncbi:MAG: hypothetical protein DME76_02440 [Verrucomicrobia bacterium]|nr:MAG: hypothetical protein DME76_02440 [Verrucomicrobiota bacterium]